MTTYYRFTGRNNPLSDWGHAMFADNEMKVENYGGGRYGWTLDKSHTVWIWDLEDDILTAWQKCIEQENFGQLSDTHYWLNDFNVDDLMPGFDPRDIVDSAEWYDHDMVCWLWDFVLEPKGIMAVRTNDGAVCFDQNLIKPYNVADVA